MNLPWVVTMGTIITLSFAVGFVFILFYHERTKRKDEQKYLELFNDVNDIIYIHSFDGILLKVNKNASKLLSLPESSIIGHSIEEFLPHSFRKYFNFYLDQIRNPRATEELTGIFPLLLPMPRAGELVIRIIEYRSKVVRDTSYKSISVWGIARDQTNNVQYQRSLKKSSVKMSKLFQQSETMRVELSGLSQKMMQIQEEDRLRISRELHDEVGQIITAIRANLEFVKNDLSPDNDMLIDRLSESQTLARDVTQKVRRVIEELRSGAIDELGLLAALGKYVEGFQRRTGIRVFFQYDPMEDSLTLPEKNTIYRIVQESLTNIARHAKATEAHISLFERQQQNGEGVTSTFLEIADNGIGMILDVAEKDHSENLDKKRMTFGILGIQERVKLLSGSFDLKTSQDGGTRIQITLPRKGL